MRTLIAGTAARSAALVAVVLLVGATVVVWCGDRAATQRYQAQQVDLVAAVLTVTTDQDALRTALARTSPSGELAVHLADGHRIGPSRAGGQDVTDAARFGPRTVPVADGTSRLRPVPSADGAVAVVEQHLSGPALRWRPILALAGLTLLALLAVAGAVQLTDRRLTPVVGQLRRLGDAAVTSDLAGLTWRPAGRTVPELAAIATMIDRVGVLARQLVEREHKMIADVSHRLRTPLTALLLDVEAIAPGPVTERIRSAVVALEHDVGEIIRAAARPPGPVEPTVISSDLADVVHRRMQFWRILAENQGRPCEVDVPTEPAMVPLVEDDVADVVNNLVGNVFRHTEPGAALAVSVGRHNGWISLVVDDGGPGIADPEAALQRGVSGGDSTGLGLDIARTRVEAVGGTIHIERGKLGGARVRLRFAETGPAGRAHLHAPGRGSVRGQGHGVHGQAPGGRRAPTPR